MYDKGEIEHALEHLRDDELAKYPDEKPVHTDLLAAYIAHLEQLLDRRKGKVAVPPPDYGHWS